MSAHFDGGAEIAGRRLREVEVTYVDDPTLDMGAEDSDDCPASPPPTYYLRVREEKKGSDGGRTGPNRGSDSGSTGSDGCGGQRDGGGETTVAEEGRRDCNGEENCDDGDGNGVGDDSLGRRGRKERKAAAAAAKGKAWSWRYVNVEKKALLVWDRRGGRLLRSIPLKQVESLLVTPDPDAPASILEVHTTSPLTTPDASVGGANKGGTSGSKASSSGNGGSVGNGANAQDNDDDDDDNNDNGSVSGDDTSGDDASSGNDNACNEAVCGTVNKSTGTVKDNEGSGQGEGDDAARRRRPRPRQQAGEEEGGGGGGGTVLVLQARSRRETLLWAKVLQENVELMTKRLVPLENRDEETNLSDVQQLAKLLTHQLSELQHSGGGGNKEEARANRAPSCGLARAGAGSAGATETIPEGIEGGAEGC